MRTMIAHSSGSNLALPRSRRLGALGALGALLLATPAGAQTGHGAAPPTADRWTDRVETFVGLDGSKQPQDLGVNANIGPRLAVNVGLPVVAGAGLGVQLGAALNASDAAVAVLERVDGTSRRTQLFGTVGLFQRTSRLSWAVAYDHLHQWYFDTVGLGQVRGELLTSLGSRDWVGASMTRSAHRAHAAIGETAVTLTPITQLNAVARHSWSSGATTGLWVGVAGGHHNVVLVFPENTRDRHVLVYGADLSMPLNNRWSVVGATNLITPSASGTVDAFMGVTVRFGRGQLTRLSPVLPVANNTSFPIDLAR